MLGLGGFEPPFFESAISSNTTLGPKHWLLIVLVVRPQPQSKTSLPKSQSNILPLNYIPVLIRSHPLGYNYLLVASTILVARAKQSGSEPYS
jgi:hypothetical protein